MPAEPFVFETQEVDTDYEDFFSIDGEMFQIRKFIPPSLSLKALSLIREQGEAAVIPWMFDEVCSEGAYEALEGCESLRPEQLKAVVNHVNDRVVGQLEKSLGKSRNGSRRSAGS